MKRILLLGTAAVALIASPLAFQNSADAQISTRSEAMTVDASRGVLTMAPLLERVTPAVVSIRTLQEAERRLCDCRRQPVWPDLNGHIRNRLGHRPRDFIGSKSI